jgi:hypothetical protein
MINVSESSYTVSNLISKKALCMYVLTAAILFFNMSNNKNSKIPKKYAVIVSLALIFYGVITSLFAHYSYSKNMNRLIEYCKNNKCIETQNNLIITKYFYDFTSFIFNSVMIIISYLLIKY